MQPQNFSCGGILHPIESFYVPEWSLQKYPYVSTTLAAAQTSFS